MEQIWVVRMNLLGGKSTQLSSTAIRKEAMIIQTMYVIVPTFGTHTEWNILSWRCQ
jgi:hypothetical protein